MKLFCVSTYSLLLITIFTSCDIFGSENKPTEKGKEIWSVSNTTDRLVKTKPVITDGDVYFLQDNSLKSYEVKTGNRNWATQTYQQLGAFGYSRSLLQDGNYVFVDQGYDMQAFSMETGQEIWHTPITDVPNETSGLGSPVMSQDETYLYAGRKGYVLKIRKGDGQIIHRFPLGVGGPNDTPIGATEPLIASEEDILYVPAYYYDTESDDIPISDRYGTYLYAFDANSGEQLWVNPVTIKIADTSTEAPDDSLIADAPIYDAELTDNAVVGLMGMSVVSISRTNGQKFWDNYFPQSGFNVGLAITDNFIYVASVGSYAHKLNLQTGEELWRTDIGASNYSIPTVQNGRFFMTVTGGGNNLILNTDDGSIIYDELPPNFENDSFDVFISSLGVGDGYMVNVGSKAAYGIKIPE